MNREKSAHPFEHLAAYARAEDHIAVWAWLVSPVNNLRRRRKLFDAVIARYTERIWQAT